MQKSENIRSFFSQLPLNKRQEEFENFVNRLYEGNGWSVKKIENIRRNYSDILISHPKQPNQIIFLIKAVNISHPLTFEEAKEELQDFEKEKSKKYKCKQFCLIALNGFEKKVKFLEQYNLLLYEWKNIEELLLSYNSSEPSSHPPLKLFAHNKIAYEKIKKFWKKTNSVAVVQATGTGKSYLIARILQDFALQEKLVIAPSNYILMQIKEIVSSVMKTTRFITYAKAMYLTEDEIKSMNISLIVLDEFHRCGAEEWGRGVRNILNAYPDANKFGTSATPIRYLDHSRDMTIEMFDGNVAENLSLAQAIVRSILPMPKYITALYSLDIEVANLKEKVNNSYKPRQEKQKLLFDIEVAKIDWEKSFGIPTVLKKHLTPQMNKFIIFCEDEEHLNEIQPMVCEWFCQSGSKKKIKSYRVLSSETKSDRNFELFKSAKSVNEIHLLFSINMLNEGLHVKEVDGVILLRPTESPIIFFQQIGRCLAAGSEKTPVIFDFVNNFKSIHSTDFVGQLEFIRKQENSVRQELGLDDINPGFTVIDELREITEVFGKINFTLVSWEVMFERLKKYKEIFGDCNVPARYKEDIRLSYWVNSQRIAHRKGDLENGKERKLNDIGFVWDPLDFRWEKQYEQLKIFVKSHGKWKAALSALSGNHLNWVNTQRQNYKKGLLSDRKINLLTSLGLELNPKGKFEKRWEQNFKELIQYHDKYSNWNISSTNKKFAELTKWVKVQRQSFRKGLLSGAKINRLNEIHFEWNSRSGQEAIWYKRLDELKKYKKQYGDCDVPRKWKVNNGLSIWVELQRKKREKGKLTNEKTEELNRLRFIWNPINVLDKLWEKRFYELKEYKKKYGHCNVPKNWDKNNSLASWVSLQRKNYKKGKLSPERLKKLCELNFKLTDIHDKIWIERLEELRGFIDVYGHCNVSQSDEFNKALGNWVVKQRQAYKKGILSEDRILQLDQLEFQWSVTEESWLRMFESFKDYKKRHGNTDVIKDRNFNKNLATWVTAQRRAYSKKQLSKEKIARLKSIGFEWDIIEKAWNKQFNELKNYKKIFHHCNVPARWKANKKLANWVHGQRQKFKVNKLSPDKVKALENIGFEWNMKSK